MTFLIGYFVGGCIAVLISLYEVYIDAKAYDDKSAREYGAYVSASFFLSWLYVFVSILDYFHDGKFEITHRRSNNLDI